MLVATIKGETELEKMLALIEAVTEYSVKEIRDWPIEVIKDISNQLVNLGNQTSEFHPLVQYGDTMYGFATLRKSTLGEYIDLEAYLKEPIRYLPYIAAILYRPVIKHKFDSFSFQYKYGVGAVNNKVTDVFKWYDVQPYDLDDAEKQIEVMKDFPLQFILGAMSFTLATASLYLGDIQSSADRTVKMAMRKNQKKILEILSQSIGDGLVRFSPSQKLIYSRLPEIKH
tara:strand:- start:1743 stop:2426 length:684 start_codon:yes stop_codon:yes gene_type:complete